MTIADTDGARPQRGRARDAHFIEGVDRRPRIEQVPGEQLNRPRAITEGDRGVCYIVTALEQREVRYHPKRSVRECDGLRGIELLSQPVPILIVGSQLHLPASS